MRIKIKRKKLEEENKDSLILLLDVGKQFFKALDDLTKEMQLVAVPYMEHAAIRDPFQALQPYQEAGRNLDILLSSAQLNALVGNPKYKVLAKLAKHKTANPDNFKALEAEIFVGGKKQKKKDFFIKPAGVSLLGFIEDRLKVYQASRDEQTKALVAQKENNVYYHTSLKQLKVGDIIKPYWTKENTQGKRMSSPLGFGGNTVDWIESEFERLRPKNKPQRMNSLFAWKNIEDVYKHAADQERTIYKIKPLSGAKINIGSYMAILEVATSLRDGEFYEDEENIRGIDEQIEEIINRYWNGQDTDDLEVVIGPPGAVVVGIVNQ
jgi:hypothetical protein